MMSGDLRDTLGQLLERLLSLANQDDEIRFVLNKLARQIVHVTDARVQHRSASPEALLETPASTSGDDSRGDAESAEAAVLRTSGHRGDAESPETTAPWPSGASDTSSDELPLDLAGSTMSEEDPEDIRWSLPTPPERTTAQRDEIEDDRPAAGAASTISQGTVDLEGIPTRSTRTRLRESRPELSLIEARCRLKAEGAHWAAARRRLAAEGADWHTIISPKDAEIISRAKELADCFLWMNHPSGPTPSDLRLFECLAGCFEVLADGVGMLDRLLGRDELTAFPKALDLLAEAQSTVRVAVSNLSPVTDTDQLAVYEWLRFLTREHQIFVPRFMRIDDVPDPAQWNDLSARIDSLDSAIEEQRGRKRRHTKLLGKVRHKSTLLVDGADDADSQWRILGETVDELINTGLPPSNLQLREYLIPVLDLMPETFAIPRGLHRTLREIDQFLASTSPVPEPAEAATAPEVLQVRALLSRRSLLMIGGHRRPLAARAIEEAFDLRELIWNDAREHESLDNFAPFVARPEVAAVILAIRWSSHSFGEVRTFCDRHDKPLVRLPGGYNPKQLAAQILAQCSDRLRSVGAK